jgi:hypothetical protein
MAMAWGLISVNLRDHRTINPFIAQTLRRFAHKRQGIA